MSVVRSLVFVWTLAAVSIGLQWAPIPKDGDVIYACVGDDVTFPWSFTLSPGEETTSIEWLFDGSSQEMMAFLSHGVFLSLPAFSGRVQQTANGGIVLSHVAAGDAGNYSLNINILGSADVIKHTLVLQVASGLPTDDGHLNVLQQPNAVLDSSSQQWSLVLSCGHFNFLAQPIFPMEWLSPSGQVISSSAYHDGYFDLHLTSPVEGGTYTCRVPQQHVSLACLHGNNSVAGQASVVLDKMEARMTLMEAEVVALRHDKQQLQQQVTDLTHNMAQRITYLTHNMTQQVTDLTHNLSQQVTDLTRVTQQVNQLSQVTQRVPDLTQQVDNLTNANVQLRQDLTNAEAYLRQEMNSADVQLKNELSALEMTYTRGHAALTSMIQDAKTPLVGFNAQATIFQTLPFNTHIKFNSVLYNAGNGYDSATGDFSAPLAGTYFFIFHTRSNGTHHADSSMVANNRAVCHTHISNNDDHGSCHAVVHLMKGNKVWMQPSGNQMDYQIFTTSFAGFLFHADP